MLNPRQRETLAGKFADLGNIAIGSLVFGYVLRSDAFNETSLLLGVIVGLLGYGIAVVLER